MPERVWMISWMFRMLRITVMTHARIVTHRWFLKSPINFLLLVKMVSGIMENGRAMLRNTWV